MNSNDLTAGNAKRQPPDVRALREVANCSAQAALHRSRRARALRESGANGAVSGVSLLVGGTLYALSPGWLSILGVASLAFGGLALWMAARAVRAWWFCPGGE